MVVGAGAIVAAGASVLYGEAAEGESGQSSMVIRGPLTVTITESGEIEAKLRDRA